MATVVPKKMAAAGKPPRERAEVRRRAELIAATVAEIGETGSLDATVGRIAKRAGMSPALAFHYFGDKETLFLAAMRHVLAVFGREVREALAGASTPEARAQAIIRVSFSQQNFRHEAIAAWLNFYVMAQRSRGARRLLSVYRRRLASNLSHALRPLLGASAPAAAERIGGLIDGLYLRAALDDETTASNAISQVLTTLHRELKEAS
ncbi:transcriptional regulator BetI [Palleronia sp.]|uniref:transcriptional regulator BetI n=1 Tax=Palleronia sp. TaxID=1940284 RepID=UPI0035C7A261